MQLSINFVRRLRPKSKWLVRTISTTTTPPPSQLSPVNPISMSPPLDAATTQEVIASIGSSSPNSLNHSPNIVFDTMQNALEALQGFTGVPWWLTIIGSTVLVRASFTPLILHQLRVTGRYATSAKPESDRLWNLVKQATVPGTDNSTKLKAYQIYIQGMRSVLNKHNISLFSMFSGTLVQIPVFISFVFTMRRMIRDPELAHELAQGGILWFDNLTLPDSTMILPLAAIGLTYTNLQVSLGNAPRGSIFYWLKDIGQVLLILGLPITSALPQGVFVYWTTSASFSAIQTQVLRADSTRVALGLPPIPTKGSGSMPTPMN
jgi:YidC/Oxa1 family membrane protein insertase